MKQYIKKRLLSFIIVFFGVSILCFLLLAFSGKDPAEILARRIQINASAETIERVRGEMGLDKPLPIRYLNWLGGILRGIWECRFFPHGKLPLIWRNISQ